MSVRPADADGNWWLVPAGAVADVVVGVDGDELVAVRSAPPMAGPLNHACAPMADRSARDGERRVLGPAAGVPGRCSTAGRCSPPPSLVGIADAALRLGVEYVMAREQFGVPIGSFQAVQHGLADLPGARSTVAGCSPTRRPGPSTSGTGSLDWADLDITDGTALASMAFVFASEGAAHATDRSLHYHGGYGFSEEYDIQLYYRRARGWSLVLGDTTTECLGLADRLFGAVEG